ncbi:HSP90 family protein [Paenibacillus sepulcri]|uniref:HSP90 family protein n=2 Tax=Paenibacillus sepulcri TaxID=359917 RepID=A0ABS7BXA8_9BACL|nr:HSP90 family protein [Paenibacillus sepulcri]
MNFQVNLQGVIDLLSNHLYSDPGVFIRELLQNGVDAITARKRLGHSFEEKVKAEIFPSSHTLSFQDNGCGLTESGIEQFLARIGSTTKKDNLDASDDFIGQFGVGLLSCFVVSDEIVLITRSALEGDSLEWRGKPDGTYQIKKLKKDVSVGTTVYLKAKPEYEEYFEFYRVRELLQKFGEFLAAPIYLIEEKYEQRINESLPPWRMDKEAAMTYVEDATYNKPLDIIPLRSILGGVEGVAHILPFAVSLQDEKKHKVYLKNMLLSDKMNNILPPWAFFVNGILNTDSLRPTASREAFQENDLFFTVRDELGECIKSHLIGLAEQNPELFKRIILVHYASIKAMAVEDEELYALFIRHLNFETSYGTMDMAAITSLHSSILLTPTLDEFRQISRVAKSQELMVINGGYVHDFELVRKVASVMEHVKLTVLDILEFSNRFEPLGREEQMDVQPFLELSDRLLMKYQCQSLIRWFEPADLPVLYNTNQEVNFFKLAEESEKEANALFTDIVHVIRTELYEKPYARLCYNYNNQIVRKAIASNDIRIQQVCIELFYTQSLLMGNHPLGPEELRLMNDSLLEFMNMGLDRANGADL